MLMFQIYCSLSHIASGGTPLSEPRVSVECVAVPLTAASSVSELISTMNPERDMFQFNTHNIALRSLPYPVTQKGTEQF